MSTKQTAPALLAESLPHSTTELVRRCLGGDQPAWQQLVDRYARLVYSCGVRHGLSAPETEELAQEVFTTLAQTLHTIADPERLPGWLMTSARRLAWRLVQKRRREFPVEAADLGESDDHASLQPLFTSMPTMDELANEWHRQDLLGAGMARLGERCRDLLGLLFLAEAEPSYAEISARLGIATGGIGPTRTRCLQQLRSILEGLGFERD